MATVNFVTFDGENVQAPLVEGRSLMQVAIDNAVPGIDGDCGGEAACGTCHVVVDQQWSRQCQGLSAEEEQMLEMNPDRQATSRLSCQVALTEDMDGLTVHLPEFQF